MQRTAHGVCLLLGRVALAIVCALSLLIAPAHAAGPSLEPDWSTWQHIPTLENGRRMPLNTFAIAAAEGICGAANPRLSLAGAAGPDGNDAPGLVDAQRLFPDGNRKFTAAELLLSWLVEPQRWECVPFLAAGHEQLRTELLGLPVMDKKTGQRLKYASPWQVAAAPKFQECMRTIFQKRREAESRMEKVRLTTLEQKAQDLYNAFAHFRLITFDPRDAQSDHTRFIEKFSAVNETWRGLQTGVARLAAIPSDQSMSATAEKVGKSIEELVQQSQKGVEPAKTEPLLDSLEEAAGKLAAQVEAQRQMVFRDAPEGFDPQQIKGVRTQIHAMAVAAADLVRQVRQARFALYDNSRSLRLVPALDCDALESNRQPEDDLPTWISLHAVLYGSSKLLAGYPSEAVETVRKAWQEAATEYQDRDGADRTQRVTGALDRFADAVRTLGEGVETARQKLPIRHRDEKLIADTAYPPPEYTRTEVFYNQLDPFFWSWLLSCLAMVSLSLSLGVFRKPLFWLGLLLLVAAQAMNAYGLSLRVAITGWAPVTNMFETVIFVALVVAVLGLWFTLQPLVGLGLGAAWRMNAVPHTPEAVPLSDAQQSLLEPATWNAAGWVMLLPRLLLAGAVFAILALIPYGYSADHTIVRPFPRVDVGGSLPTPGNVTVWLVGMCMLLLAVWLLPRMVLATLTGVLTVPYSWAKQGLGKPMAQVLDRKPFLFAGAAVAFLAAVVAYYAPVLDKGINPLMPVLRSNLWLTMHVLTITASYGAGALAWGLALIALSHYLFGRYRDDERTGSRLPPTMCETLGDYIYKVTQVAVLLLSAGTILGGLWADVSWGRFWGWDSKEVWALISVLLYLAVLHGRYAGMFGNFGLAVGSVFGATSILMAWYGVNFVLGSGLHTYGEGAGGLSWAVVIVVANWVYVALAAFRYHAETAIPMSPPSRQPPHP